MIYYINNNKTQKCYIQNVARIWGGGLRKRSTRKSYRKNSSNTLRIRGGRPTFNPITLYKEYKQKKADKAQQEVKASAEAEKRKAELQQHLKEAKERANAHALKMQQEDLRIYNEKALAAHTAKIIKDTADRLAAEAQYQAFVHHRANYA